MRIYTAVVEKCPDTGLYVGYVPGFSGAHSQAETMDELAANLKEVLEMLLEDGEPKFCGSGLYPRNPFVRFKTRKDFASRQGAWGANLASREAALYP
jgi:predicted RNase H-like HicB family nuclease